jgi:methylamine dehydrogenase heavy chain
MRGLGAFPKRPAAPVFLRKGDIERRRRWRTSLPYRACRASRLVCCAEQVTAMHEIRRSIALLLPVLLLGLAMPARSQAQRPPELPAETLGVTPSVATAERIYVADIAISHISDGRIRVFDARNGKFLGMVSTAYAGNFGLANQAEELYVATTHLSRSTRGERVDVLEVYDTTTLGFKYEVVLPPKRAQALNYRGLVRATGDGRFVLVQNATPATSITVVDLQQRKVASEVPTPGCWGVLPAAGGARFSMLCGDGKVATVTLDGAGQVADRQVSDKVFDADNDAWFHHAEQRGDRYWFLSFKGNVTELDLSGPVAKVAKAARPLAGAGAKPSAWRPGGYQPFAVDPSGRWLVAAMHDKGNEGSHKRPAQQLWVHDLQSGQRVATAPGHGAVGLTFSRRGKRLHALDGEKGALYVWPWTPGKAPSPKPHVTVARAGEASLHFESHD